MSFDPRGTGKSRPVECVDDATADRLNAVDPTPNSDADLRAFYDGTNEPVDLVARCVARNGAWLAQLGSRNVARDLDRLRTALGDDTLSFVGYSYGTVIGAVYAQMFPDRVGRMVLDSPVDLSADALEELRGNSQGFEQALDDFLADCAKNTQVLVPQRRRPDRGARARSNVASSGASSSRPSTSPPGEKSKRTAGVAAFYTALISALYDQQYGWPELADALDDARTGDGSYLLALADLYNGRHDDGSYDNIDEVIGVILCDDRDDPVPTLRRVPRRVRPRGRAVPAARAATSAARVLGCDPRLPRPPAIGAGRRPARHRRGADPRGGHDPRSGHARSPARRTSSPDSPARACSRSTAPSTPRTPRTRASTGRSTPTCCAARCRPRARSARPEAPQSVGVSPSGGRPSTARRATGRAPSGRPSTRSPRMLRMIADVPPSIVFACARRNPRATVRGPVGAATAGRS